MKTEIYALCYKDNGKLAFRPFSLLSAAKGEFTKLSEEEKEKVEIVKFVQEEKKRMNLQESIKFLNSRFLYPRKIGENQYDIVHEWGEKFQKNGKVCFSGKELINLAKEIENRKCYY